MPELTGKAEGAFLTISELADTLGVPHHILRYWETRFPQLKPLQRAGNRRYYRPSDVDLAREIHRLLYQEGYTVKGVQKLLASRTGKPQADAPSPPVAAPSVTFTTLGGAPLPASAPQQMGQDGLLRIRTRLDAMLTRIDAALG